MNLKSRYGETWVLEETMSGLKFTLPPYTRIGFEGDNPKVLSFIDPPGGPFLQVGDLIDEKRKITGIDDYNSYVILKLEEA